MKPEVPQYGMFLAVLPSYRQNCIELVKSVFKDDLFIQVSAAHLDPSVKTGIDPSLYDSCPMVRIAGKAFLQIPLSTMPWRTPNLIVDLNPRSFMAWILLLSRKVGGRRTLVWGHIHPQSGGDTRTAGLRRLMRRLASGTISYTYYDQEKARRDLPGQRVWVAPNSIYRESDIISEADTSSLKNSVIYVGRFHAKKKVDLLLRGFAEARAAIPDMRLVLVGDGDEKQRLFTLVNDLGIAEHVQFAGWVEDVGVLRKHYAGAFASASPGFAGLGLTQSLGFGVPMVVARNEPHSPEIELADEGAVTWFDSNDVSGLASALVSLWQRRQNLPDEKISSFVRKQYSAESMAHGLLGALRND